MQVISNSDIAWTSEKPSKSANYTTSKVSGRTDRDIAMDFLDISTKDRHAADIAADIWDRLRKPSMLSIWQLNLRMYRLCVKAAKWYDNRSMIIN